MLSIVNEVDLLISSATYMISIKWYQCGLQFPIYITYFVSFGIRDNGFMMLEDYRYLIFYMVVETMI